MRKGSSLEMAVWDRLWAALHDDDDGAVAYVYRIDPGGRIEKHYLVRCEVWPGLPEILRDQYGGGDFAIRIKSGRVMKFSGRIAVVETPRR